MASQPPAEHAPFDRVAASWHGFFKEKLFFSYCRCRVCGLLYAGNYFTDRQLEQLYGEMPDNTANLALAPLERTQGRYAEDLVARPIPQGGYLEFGPDIGLFTRAVLARRTFEQVWLFEPNRAVHQRLFENAAGATGPVEILHQMADLSAVPPASVACAAMIHVLDHLADPKDLLGQLRERMVVGGVLGIVTHDESSLLAKAARKRWPPYCLQHPQLFRRETMRQMIEGSGYAVDSIGKSVNYFPLGYLARHGALVAGVETSAFDRLPGIVGLKLGNMMTIARAV